jgi:hypothetical protein
MQDDFDKWNEIKKKVDAREIGPLRLIHIKRFERNLYEMDSKNLEEIKKKLREYVT